MPTSASAASAYLQASSGHTAVLCAPGRIEIRLGEVPHPKDNDVVLRLQGCGVCASSLPVWQGRPWFEYPLPGGAPGHEGWGTVIVRGKNVTGLEVGQRVTCLGENAYTEFVQVAANQVVPLPGALDGIPFPGEAIGCVMNIFRRADIQPDQNVAIIGAGFLGLLLTELAVGAGANVHVVSRRQSVRQRATDLGACSTYDTEDWWGNARKLVATTGGRGCDRVIEVTGLQFALDTATELIAEYGKLIIAGFHQDGPRQVNMQTWNWRGIDVINAHERSAERCIQGIREAVDATVAGRILPQHLLTHRFSLTELGEAFSVLETRPDQFIKGWIALPD